jgi:hypothetical protein
LDFGGSSARRNLATRFEAHCEIVVLPATCIVMFATSLHYRSAELGLSCQHYVIKLLDIICIHWCKAESWQGYRSGDNDSLR